MRQSKETIEHHPSCKERCVSECEVSPRRPYRDKDDPEPPRVRTYHGAPVAPLAKAPPPLWEYVDDVDAVRRSGASLPLPETYYAYERADGQYSLDRWTRAGGVEDRRLDDLHVRLAEERRSKVREARDVDGVAALVRSAFPTFTSGPAPRVSPPVVKRRKGTARQEELLALVVGETPAASVPSPWVPMYEATRHIRDVMTVHIWALALILFGRERDTLSDYALGRLLHGEPVKDTRAPFASAAHALSVAERALPGLGGGSCAWPAEDPRMRARTWAKAGEMSVRGGHHGTDAIRGEHGVHRVLDARNVERRAALAPHERAAVAVLNDRNLSRDEKASALREVEAVRRGIVLDAKTQRPPVPRERAQQRPQRARHPGEQACELMLSVREGFECDGDDGGEFRATYLRRLREATADVSDGALFGAAKRAQQRVQAAVERVSREGDALAPKREDKPRKRRDPESAMPTRGALLSEVFAL